VKDYTAQKKPGARAEGAWQGKGKNATIARAPFPQNNVPEKNSVKRRGKWAQKVGEQKGKKREKSDLGPGCAFGKRGFFVIGRRLWVATGKGRKRGKRGVLCTNWVWR